MSVFIISTGERGEGSTVQAVASTIEKAIEIALAQECWGGEWKPSANHRGQAGRWVWSSGCDYVSIEKREVV